MENIKQWFRQHPFMIAICYLAFYLIVFELLEMTVVPKYIVQCKLDEVIPFCEYFIVPYVFWFVYIPGMFIWARYRSWEDYSRLCLMMFTGLTVCLAIYYFLPTGLNLRLADDTHKTGVCFRLVKYLRGIDTPTNVCPSIHVMNTVMCFQAICSTENLKHRKLTIAVHALIMVSICASTVFLDQHSVVDVVCGVLMSIVFHGLVYEVDWKTVTLHRRERAKLRRVM